MVGQGHVCKPIKFFDRIYFPFINGGTTLNKRPLLTSMTVCIEACGTGDLSTSIIVGHHSTYSDKGTREITLLLTSYSPTKLGPRRTGREKTTTKYIVHVTISLTKINKIKTQRLVHEL